MKDFLYLERYVVLPKKLQTVLIFSLFLFGSIACGDNASNKDVTNKLEPIAQDNIGEAMPDESLSQGVLEAPDAYISSMAVEDNDVIQDSAAYTALIERSGEAHVAVEAKTHTVFAQATSFSPNILFINPGDTVQWENMTIHDSVSMEGLIPEGGESWAFKLGQNGAVTLIEEGVYIYKCNPHYPLGMVAAIIVGKPVNIEQVQANATGRAKGIVMKVVKALAKR